MSGTASGTSFFSFGPDDSFISKCFEGLRYRDLPQSLHQLIVSGSVKDVHWAALGPLTDSWVLSFRDRDGKHNLGWGSTIPATLHGILQSLTPSQHFRAFIGTDESFIVWDPSLIRWANLPAALEACLQGWLTPAGWRAGPPKMVSWGLSGTFLAMTEYGDVSYSVGSVDEWPLFKETVDEWDAEDGFEWSHLAYLSLDCTTPDQFIAIRQDRTWAGSAHDSGEEALESFAMNFFRASKPRKPKPKPKPKASHAGYGESNGIPMPSEVIPDASTQALYEKWATEVANSFALALAALGGAKGKPPKKLQVRNPNPKPVLPTTGNANADNKLLNTFPYLPSALTTCVLQSCLSSKEDPKGLKACKHDVERLLRLSGLYGYEWLRQERLRWHPDRFGRLCEEGWRESGKKLAEEMFKIIDGLISELERQAANGTV